MMSSWPRAVGPCDQGAVSRNLVVFDRLRRPDNGRIKHIFVGDFPGEFIRFAA